MLSAANDQVLGRLVNITAGGLMFLSNQEYPVGTTLNLRLPLPTMANGKTYDLSKFYVVCTSTVGPEKCAFRASRT